jgi:hypothetical protein
MRKCAEYRAMAIAHARFALMTKSDELCETHVRIAASLLALANEQAIRESAASRCHWRGSAGGACEIMPAPTGSAPFHPIGR